MKLLMVKELSEEEKESLKDDILSRYESADRLKQKVSRSGCREPGMVDEYKILEALMEGADYRKERINKTPESISVLTPRRVELLEYLKDEDVGSIQELSDGIDRDYKNVYDDIRALSENGILELKQQGKRKKPILDVDELVVQL